ncbi:MAG: bifunctional demethylmenaquinone methyltransferase/2-methoxy-6-polyprenyl-1,4-benzoquinol methylase UbiE [Campylobacterales bacterium]|nr:bifunctional demethylmenaquinone methyltransferase/2-methoxy-6-polyprenyl-1,4-benzoquinol methylase UbiE [Campylobacterales bacterium]
MANTITTNDQSKIIDMFNNISSTYDLLNRLLSFGIDQRWRKTACKKVLKGLEKDDLTIIDVACGTGDMLIAWKETSHKLGRNISSFVGVDPSVGMLNVAREKISWCNFKEGKATELPFEDNSIDIISITYGIRNVVDLESAFKEFYRVLKPGGRLVILEFAKQERESALDKFAKWYLHQMIPLIGGLISKDKGAYKYLPDSIAGFITSNELNNIQKNCGFEIVETKDYSFKISTMFISKKPE